MTKILFLIHDLGVGGAEKVLVNLVNHMDPAQFDVTVMVLFGGGVNEQFLKPHVRCRAVFQKTFPANSKLMKLLTPRQLHRRFIREHYDIEAAFLEGPSTRIISGCPDPDTKLVTWLHCTIRDRRALSASFRSWRECVSCYGRFDRIFCVSQNVAEAFHSFCGCREKTAVLYNVNDSDAILQRASEAVEDGIFDPKEFKLIGVGKIVPVKGFDRLARVHVRLRRAGYPVHSYILGTGKDQAQIEAYLREHGCQDSFTFLGYQTNPYKYVSKCDLFVCSSLSEGFSTAATEALIVGTPVCTVDVSGMKEMLGEHNEYGIVTENNEDAMYAGIRALLDTPGLLQAYRQQASLRGASFSTQETVAAVQNSLFSLL